MIVKNSREVNVEDIGEERGNRWSVVFLIVIEEVYVVLVEGLGLN